MKKFSPDYPMLDFEPVAAVVFDDEVETLDDIKIVDDDYYLCPDEPDLDFDIYD